MGVGGLQRQGLWTKTRDVFWDDQNTHDLTRISEVGVVTDFGVPLNVAVQIRIGLRIGMQFRSGHAVGTDSSHRQRIEFAVAPKDAAPADLPALPWQNLDEDRAVTAQLKDVFGNEGQWLGYKITGAMLGAPPSSASARLNERLYFRIRILNFHPNSPGGHPQRNNVHVVPTVCILEGLDFATHYALGIGAFTVGKGKNALEFDSQILARDPAEQEVPPKRHTRRSRAAAGPKRRGARRAKAARRRR